MHKYLFSFMAVLLSQYCTAQNVGIGTTTPLARLQVTDSSVLFSSNNTSVFNEAPPISGSGKRLMWYINKAAFRVGLAVNTFWDKDSVGFYSVATGRGTIAKGEGSFAAGLFTKAAGRGAIAAGANSYAGGESSVAFGTADSASGNYSFVCGIGNFASGFASTAIGKSNRAFGDHSFAAGDQTLAEGLSTTALGASTYNTGTASVSMGVGNNARGYASLVVGHYNEPVVNTQTAYSATNTPLFIVGNGTAPFNRSNALLVNSDGKIGINQYPTNNG